MEYAITKWAKDADDVLLYMTGHGIKDIFYLNENETLQAELLDSWLDTLQQVMQGNLVVIYDACLSGSFISKLIPPDSKERIVITSSEQDRNAGFYSDGLISFSYFFWSTSYVNPNLYATFSRAKKSMKEFQMPIKEFQNPMFDTDGDGKPVSDAIVENPSQNEEVEKNRLRNYTIGRGRFDTILKPKLSLNTSPEIILNGNLTTTISVEVERTSHEISQVWVVIVPPYYISPTNEAQTSLNLLDTNYDDIYSADYQFFEQQGTYRLLINALDINHQLADQIMLKVIQTDGIRSPKGDVSGDNQINLMDAIIALQCMTNNCISSLIRFDYSTSDVDVTNNDMIGMDDLVFILEQIGKK